jgi:hypothetical protein
MAITEGVLDELLKGYEKPEDLLGENGLLKQLQKRLLEKAMGVELTVHLGYGKHEVAGRNTGNRRGCERVGLHQRGLLGLTQRIDHGGSASAIRREINHGLGRVCRVCRGEK